jgi:hypothetical protein
MVGYSSDDGSSSSHVGVFAPVEVAKEVISVQEELVLRELVVRKRRVAISHVQALPKT